MATDTKKTLRHHHHHHAPVIHDLGLLHFLIYLWFGIVLIGLVLDRGYLYFHDHSLFSLVPTFSSSFAPLTQVDDWTHLEAHGDVDLSYKTIIPTSGLHAHRAEVVADLPIEALLHVFRDTPNNVSVIKYTCICAYVYVYMYTWRSLTKFPTVICWISFRFDGLKI